MAIKRFQVSITLILADRRGSDGAPLRARLPTFSVHATDRDTAASTAANVALMGRGTGTRAEVDVLDPREAPVSSVWVSDGSTYAAQA